jgi:hypothetical protein
MTYQLKLTSMYHISKEVYVKKKPQWLIDLLFQIDPSLYRGASPREDVEKRFNRILSTVLSARVRWHQGHSQLTKIQKVTYDKDNITIQRSQGIDILSFKIESAYSSLNK